MPLHIGVPDRWNKRCHTAATVNYLHDGLGRGAPYSEIAGASNVLNGRFLSFCFPASLVIAAAKPRLSVTGAWKYSLSWNELPARSRF